MYKMEKNPHFNSNKREVKKLSTYSADIYTLQEIVNEQGKIAIIIHLYAGMLAHAGS